MELTQDMLMQALEYNPSTGVFIRRLSRSGFRAGTQAGAKNKKDGYIRINLYRTHYLAHRLAWFYVHGTWPVLDLDHINRIRSDNRMCNLREATRAENMQNMTPRKNKHGLPGVYWAASSRKWRADICVNGKVVRLGLFNDRAEAGGAYEDAKKQLHPFYVHEVAA